MFKVLNKLRVRDIYCVSVEGDTRLLKNGLELTDEKGNKYVIRTVAMVHYCNIEDSRNHADLALDGDVKNIGETLYLEKKMEIFH